MDNKTPIIVALIGVIGTITVALIINWHSIFPPAATPIDRPAAPIATAPSAEPPTMTATPAPTSPAPAPAPAAADPGSATAAGSAAAPPATSPSAATKARPWLAQAVGPARIDGQWEDADDEYRYAFTQSAAAFRYSASERGQDRGGGGGTIIGRTLIYDFQSGDGPGTCRAMLAPDGKTISGSCTRGSETFPVRLRRPATLVPLDSSVRTQRP